MENLTQNKSPKETNLDSLKFFKRPGTTDRGGDYEDYVTANFVLKFLHDQGVKDFKLSSNDNDYGAFDDVIIEVEYSNGEDEKYAIQLKHKDNTVLKIEHLDSKPQFRILKYFKSFQKNKKTLSICKLVLWTNLKFKPGKSTEMTLDDETKLGVKILEWPPLRILDNSHQNCYKIEVLPNESFCPEKMKELKEFFKRFFLCTNQPDVDYVKTKEIPKNVAELTSDQSFIKKFLEFISNWSRRKGVKEKLTKFTMQKVVALILLNNSICSHRFGETAEDAKLFQKAICRFDVAVFKNKSLNSVRRIWREYKDILRREDIGQVNNIRKQFQISERNVKSIDDLTEEQCTRLLWVMNLCPLIVKNTQRTLEAVKICGQTDKFVVITDDPDKDITEDMGKRRVFRKLKDLKHHRHLYEEVVTDYQISLFGEKMNLHQLIGLDDRFEEITTTDTLLSLINNCDFLEQKEEEVPLYIERFLYKTTIDLEHVHRVDQKTLILISNIDKQQAESIFRNFEIVNLNDKIAGNTERRKIYINASDISQKEFSELCKTNYDNCHHFKFGSNELEWIESVNGVSDLQEICVQNEQLLEDEMVANMRNKINIIVGNAGIGKTFLLKKLKNRLISKNLVVYLSAKEAYNLFKDLKEVTEFYDVMFRSDDFKKLLSKNGKLVVLWDALDEVSEKEIITIENLILDLSKDGVTNFVTSRQHLKSKLENKFGVLAKELRPFDEKQQIDYIQKSVENMKGDVIKSIQKLPEMFGTPLYIFLLTELYREDPKQYKEIFIENLCVTDLYHNFIDRQFLLYFKEKCKIVLDNYHTRKMLEQYKFDRIEEYQAFALKLLFDDRFFSKLNLKSCDRALSEFSKCGDPFGLVNRVREEEQQAEFIHMSYAEYFAALYLYDNCGKIDNLSDIIFDKKHANVKLFFDMLSAKGSPIHIATLNKNLNYLEKNLDKLTLLDLQGRSPLQIAASWCERYPLLKVTKQECLRKEHGYFGGRSYSVNDKTDYVTNPQSETDKKMIKLLLKRCDLDHKDSLFHFTATMYAERNECIVTAAIIEKQRRSDYLKSKNDSFICSLLYYSAKYGITDILDMFDDIEFVHNNNNDSLLHIAVQNDRYEYVSKLLLYVNYKRNINFMTIAIKTPLHVAAQNGNLSLLQLLIEKGADVNAAIHNGEAPLFWAAKNGHPDVAKFLVENGADVNATTNIGATILHWVAKNGHLELAKLLVEKGSDVNATTHIGATVLHWTVKNGHLDIAKFLVENGADVNATTNFGETILHWAAENGHLDIAKFLVGNGADVNAATNSGETILHWAARNGHLEVTKFLVENEANFDATTKNGETILHWASRNGHLEVARLLVKNGANLSVTTNGGETILQWAANNGHLDFARFLVKNGADVDVTVNNGETILHWAARNKHLEFARLLVKNGANVSATTHGGETILQWAANNGHLDFAIFLVKNGADANTTIKNGETILHWAAKSKHLEFAKLLVENGADVNATTTTGTTVLYLAARNRDINLGTLLVKNGADVNAKTKSGITILHWTANNGHLDFAKFLVKNGANVNATVKNGEPPLVWATRNGHVDVAKFLLENGANVDATTNIGATILNWAAKNGHLDFIQLLVKNGADVNATTNTGITILHWAANNGHLDVVKFLVKNGAHVNAAVNNGEAPLVWAARNGRSEVVKFLIENGADVNAATNIGATILHWVAKDGHLDLTKLLVKNGTDVNATTTIGATVLHWTATNGHVDIAKFLVENGADVNATTYFGETILHWAAENGHLDVAKFLVENGASVNAKTSSGETILHWATRSGHLDVAKFLVESDADLSATTNSGESILHWVARNGHLDIAKLLMIYGADVNEATNSGETILQCAANNGHLDFARFLVKNAAGVKAEIKSGETILQWATRNGHLEFVKLLVENEAGVSATTNTDATILQWAATNGHLDIAKLLVKNGTDINATTNTGATILQWAANSGQLDFARFLVKNGADVNATTSNGEAPLVWAARSGHSEVAKFLIENGADVNATTNLGATILHWVAKGGRLDLTKLLVKNGTDVNATTNIGATVLHWTARNGHLHVAKFLVENGAEVSATTSCGETILHWAAENGHLDTAKFLVENGADVNATTNNGETILHWAARSGHLSVVKFLVENGADLSATTNSDETILHWVARNGHLDITKFLVENGADPNATTNTGETILHWAARNGHLEIARLLVKNGANVNATTNNDVTPLYIAKLSGYQEVVDFLFTLNGVG